jgi:hypothetical protein
MSLVNAGHIFVPHASAPKLRADQVIVAISAGHVISSLGRQEAHRAAMINDPNFIGFAAADAGYVHADLDPESPPDNPSKPKFTLPDGTPMTVEQIAKKWARTLLPNMGIRFIDPSHLIPHIPSDIAAPLPHNLERGSEEGGLRHHMGLRESDVSGSDLKDSALLFTEDPSLKPSLQSQICINVEVGALAALPEPLPKYVPKAYRFRQACGTCLPGEDSAAALKKDVKDQFANRLAGKLGSNGSAMTDNEIAKSLPLGKARQKPERIDLLVEEGDHLSNVPQAPLVVQAACASALMAFNAGVPSLLWDYPGLPKADMLLSSGVDAALADDYDIMVAFGDKALVNGHDLVKTGRSVADCLAPLDQDATGTVVGNGGGAVLFTTLEFAVKNFLPIKAIVPGWGQSGETGGKQHMAGVGYGGDNALAIGYNMADEGHGFGVEHFGHLGGHLTGTTSNTKTDLSAAKRARRKAAKRQGKDGNKLPKMTLGATKAKAAHTQGAAGMLALQEGIFYVMGKPTVGIPTFRKLHKDIGAEAEDFEFSSSPVPGSLEKGVAISVQGFGGYNAAMLLMPATESNIRRYEIGDSKLYDAYFERREEIDRELEKREASWNRKRGNIRELALRHRWPPVT